MSHSKLILPYGDTLNDGKIQFSFTLPVEASEKGKEAAREILRKLNCHDPKVVHMEKVSDEFTVFVAYASLKDPINLDKIKVHVVEAPQLDFKEINALIKSKLKRKIRVVGANTGFDAHTVGIDAIINMKGWKGDYGLERYPMIEAYNLGAQVTPEELLEFSIKNKIDAILISKIVDQKDIHVKDLKDFNKLLEERKLREKFIVVAGGPRITHKLACELGYDAGFGSGTLPSQVASFIVYELMKKN